MLLGWLDGGGAERVSLHLLNRSNAGGPDVRMGLLRRAGAYLPQADPRRLHVRAWSERCFQDGAANASFYRAHRLAIGATVAPLAFRSIVREVRPDVVMSVSRGPNIATWLALAGMGPERPFWIAREGNNLARTLADEAGSAFKRRGSLALFRRAYRAADCVLANSTGLAGSLERSLGIEPGRIRVIRNPVDLDRVRRLAAAPPPWPAERPFIVSVGRLERQKGHDLLLRAFAAAQAARDHALVIVGQGSEQAALRALAAELGLAERVHFAPFTANPWRWIGRARLFVLPSRWEGFPNALLESLACGTPALAADCRFGPGEMIRHGASGWLVPAEDPEALAAALERLLPDMALRGALGAAGARRAADFADAVVLPRYDRLFHEAAVAGRRRRRLAAAGWAAAPLYQGLE